ncbi:MAG: glycosyltransferase family 4 protein [Planctomycetales bacterium]
MIATAPGIWDHHWMPETTLSIIYLTPGAGGMICGSCLSDNMLAANMHAQGHQALLVPLYTPITTDEPNASINKLFFGGINVYLQQKVPLFRALPRFLDRVLDWPALVGLFAGRAVGLPGEQLGALTLSMVRGEHGHQRKEVRRLVDWLAARPRPDVVNLSNLLIGGCIPANKRRLNVPIVVTLQGDDLFLDDLPDPYRAETLVELQSLAAEVDRFIVHSRFYADKMAEYFQIPADRFEVVPLGISPVEFSPPAEPVSGVPIIGYLARICPAKGLHILVNAYLKLKQTDEFRETRLHVAGWLGEVDREYFEEQQERIRDAGWEDHFQYAGVLDRAKKYEFLASLDLLSVPTTYEEPKGRFVLEALACGTPVVQPAHGAFPELLDRTGGGRLFQPNDADDLAAQLTEILADPALRREMSEQGRQGVLQHAHVNQAVAATLAVYKKSCLPQ